ncbi:MAG: tRNA (adenosine(37)-N6)-threonylcarbamoyltransferase complex transferase subunit TsaD [Tissierellia bacterium]|nr:tRNA (adenosine(37)-N6)-threonylcarbamoyltransferase complex transferase subunit TsaD [Tissierellia bacterium]
MNILAIESSCDETAASVLIDGRTVLSNVISSQIDVHKQFGGVVPEIASRKHLEAICTVVEQALEEANMSFEDIDLVGATRGPGLIGALLVGLSYGKGLAYSLAKPFVGVNHMQGHICANYISYVDLEPPFVSLVVSGGHTYLIHVKDYIDYEIIGRTRDDAAGEAFDKVARTIGLGYPGGPKIDALAKKGKDNIDFPRVFLEEDSYDFSFSGLKTAVLNYINSQKQKGLDIVVEDVATSFQTAVLDVLVTKSIKLTNELHLDKIVLSGGVAANDGLRERLEREGEVDGISIYYPPKILCTDNAAMIGSAAYYQYEKYGEDDLNIKANPNLGL